MFDKLEPRYDQELLQYMQWIVVVDSFMIGGVVIDFVDLGLMDLDRDGSFYLTIEQWDD